MIFWLFVSISTHVPVYIWHAVSINLNTVYFDEIQILSSNIE